MNLGWTITDKRGGENVIHSWDMCLKGEVSKEQRELLDIILRGRRLSRWRRYPGEEGRPLTTEMIRELHDCDGLQAMLDDLTAKGYLDYRHPRKWFNGHRVADKSEPMGYDIAFGQLSFEVTHLLDEDCVCPTLVPTDIGHIGIMRRIGSD